MSERPPAIHRTLWVERWVFFAICTAVVVELLATSSSELFTAPLRLVARWAIVLAVLAFAVPLVFAVEFWWSLVLHARRNYAPDVARKLIRVESAVIGICVAVYATAVFLLLRWLWRVLERWSHSLSVTLPPRAGVGWVGTIGLIAVVVFLALWVAGTGYLTLSTYARSVRILGVRRALRGVAMMLLLRARQPRRAFFQQVPVIADMLPLSIGVVAYAFIPSAPFAAAIGLLIPMAHASVSLSYIRPPTWLFLGASEYEGFAAFRKLRLAWDVTAVTLLDHTNDDGRAFYDAERSHWSRFPLLPKGLFYNPTVPRVWSLRTRPHLWGHTVVLLIDYVTRVVVDVRHMSDYVREELVWLAEPGRIEKSWFIVGDGGLTPELAALIPSAAHARALTEEALAKVEGP